MGQRFNGLRPYCDVTYGDIIQPIFAHKTYSCIVAMIGGVSQPNSLVCTLSLTIGWTEGPTVEQTKQGPIVM